MTRREELSPRQRVCICTTTERLRNRPFVGCAAHDTASAPRTNAETLAALTETKETDRGE